MNWVFLIAGRHIWPANPFLSDGRLVLSSQGIAQKVGEDIFIPGTNYGIKNISMLGVNSGGWAVQWAREQLDGKQLGGGQQWYEQHEEDTQVLVHNVNFTYLPFVYFDTFV